MNSERYLEERSEGGEMRAINIIKNKILTMEKDHTKAGFPHWSHEEQLLRTYALGVSDERFNLCQQLEKDYPEIPWSDYIYGVGGD